MSLEFYFCLALCIFVSYCPAEGQEEVLDGRVVIVSHLPSHLYWTEEGGVSNRLKASKYKIKKSCHKDTYYFINEKSGLFLSVTGGCGNTNIGLESAKLTRNQRFRLIFGDYANSTRVLASKCDLNMYLTINSGRNKLLLKKKDPSNMRQFYFNFATVLNNV
ncbi:uncharacterized protein LOC132696832 [Cylas formicarius]|uniref:uncharacterized protein LOC132696832 n=1 Tax=Cylas formicarius TaxID=197179 RepID=UPI002958BEF6|nr:uncharacterized protein LOC132696832 [Cylas formicarius]